MTYAWFNIDGKQVYRRVPEERVNNRSGLSMPMIISDRINPVQSMADGKVYDSMTELRRSHAGFTEGQAFDPNNIKRPDLPQFTKKDAAELVEKSTAAINNGYKVDVVDKNF